jgi:hypothetical protein
MTSLRCVLSILFVLAAISRNMLAYGQICPVGQTGGFVAAANSSTVCARFFALMMHRLTFSSVATRLNIAATTDIPTYDALGGPNGYGHLSFRAASYSYIRTSTDTLAIGTNGGFTVVTLVRFVSPVMQERVISVGGWTGSEWRNVFHVHRSGTGTQLSMVAYDYPGLNSESLAHTGELFSNTWIALSATYQVSSKTFRLVVHDTGVAVTRTGSTLAFGNMASTRTIIGAGINTQSGQRTVFNQLPTQFSNTDIAGVFMVAEFLGDETIRGILDEMRNGVDFTDTVCPFGRNCTQCAVGKMKTLEGASLCRDIPCPPGYTGSGGVSCAPCGAGTYKSVAGSSACLDCVGGTYSPANASVCVACGQNSNSPVRSSTCVCNVGFGV